MLLASALACEAPPTGDERGPVELPPHVPLPPAAPAPSAEVMPEPRCPPDMVRVAPPDRQLPPYCVDRYEASLVTDDTGEPLSPYYTPSRRQARYAASFWAEERTRMGDERAQQVPLPFLAPWQLDRDYEPRAVVRESVTPNGHVTGLLARAACDNAGRRLCTEQEWRIACGGEHGWAFPYGERYEHGKCNVFREGHPAHILHDNASIGHSDPRLNRVAVNGRPLLRATGATPTCASRWGDDAIYDMVGNLDEWVDDPGGVFRGGFYSRSSKEGCDKRVGGHPIEYADYSTGVRCCATLPAVQRTR